MIDLLWSHMERDRGQNALRQTIWQLKARLGDDFLHAWRDRVSLASVVSTDRDAFLAAIAAGEIERAVDLYRGDFVPGFATPGSTNFEHWADTERLELRRRFLRAAEELVQRRLATGHAREALAVARRARDLDQVNQGAWRQVLLCLIASGNPLVARVEADALSHLIESEEIAAEPETIVII
ncbi:MAG: AfsR/SARP family transcriptional regulator, partial [bacterium]